MTCHYCPYGRTTDTDHHGIVLVDHTWCEASFWATVANCEAEEEAA